MPGSKDRGSGKGSPQKQKAAARRVHQTQSNKQKKIDENLIDSLAGNSTPVKPRSRPKKQSKSSKSATSPKKQVNLSGSESGITALIVVTETKKKESQVESSSEEEESLTRSVESKKDKGSQNKGLDEKKILQKVKVDLKPR